MMLVGTSPSWPKTDSATEAPERGHVDIQVEGVEHGAGCVLFVRGGVISVLEGFTYDDEWPEHPVILELRDPCPIAPPGKGGPS